MQHVLPLWHNFPRYDREAKDSDFSVFSSIHKLDSSARYENDVKNCFLAPEEDLKLSGKDAIVKGDYCELELRQPTLFFDSDESQLF